MRALDRSAEVQKRLTDYYGSDDPSTWHMPSPQGGVANLPAPAPGQDAWRALRRQHGGSGSAGWTDFQNQMGGVGSVGFDRFRRQMLAGAPLFSGQTPSPGRTPQSWLRRSAAMQNRKRAAKFPGAGRQGWGYVKDAAGGPGSEGWQDFKGSVSPGQWQQMRQGMGVGDPRKAAWDPRKQQYWSRRMVGKLGGLQGLTQSS